ncbi:hypothetical protein L218DRAFT_953337 [Marasmius fiardii PR-910]|nr:hypothetical protein L218DRAFT_953337 [Marasmius fiardii PR-910]
MYEPIRKPRVTHIQSDGQPLMTFMSGSDSLPFSQMIEPKRESLMLVKLAMVKVNAWNPAQPLKDFVAEDTSA